VASVNNRLIISADVFVIPHKTTTNDKQRCYSRHSELEYGQTFRRFELLVNISCERRITVFIYAFSYVTCYIWYI